MDFLPIIIDDIIDYEHQNKIEDAIFDCSWEFMLDNVCGSKFTNLDRRKFISPRDYKITPTITSDVVKNQHLLELIMPLAEKSCKKINFKIDAVARCLSAIHFLNSESNQIDKIHVNRKDPHLVMIYYVIDSDGETILFDKTSKDIPVETEYPEDHYEMNIFQKIEAKKGRVLFFDGKVYHASSTSSKNYRCIITWDIFGKFLDKDISYSELRPN
jgi:hypothetical protein